MKEIRSFSLKQLKNSFTGSKMFLLRGGPLCVGYYEEAIENKIYDYDPRRISGTVGQER